MPTTSNYLEMSIGTHKTLNCHFAWPDGTPVNLTNAEVRFTVKSNLDDPQEEAKIFKANSTAGGADTEIQIVNGEGGQVDIYLLPVDTKELEAGTYVYDVLLVLSTGEVATGVKNKITLIKTVTTL